MEVALHLLEVADVVEGRQDVVGVAHPAEAVVPVAPRARRLGQRSSAGRDDGAGVLVLVNFQGQGRANHLRLVEATDAGALHPKLPVGHRFAQKPLGRAFQRGFQRGAVGEYEVVGLVEHKVLLVDDVGERDVGGEADFLGQPAIGNVVGAAPPAQLQRPVLAHRRAHHPHPRRAADRLQLANNHQRLVVAVVLREARGEVGDAVAPVGGADFRAQHVGVLLVVLVRVEHITLRGPHAELAALLRVKQATENKAAVEARPAQPAHGRIGADEGQVGAVANQAEVVGVLF